MRKQDYNLTISELISTTRSSHFFLSDMYIALEVVLQIILDSCQAHVRENQKITFNKFYGCNMLMKALYATDFTRRV